MGRTKEFLQELLLWPIFGSIMTVSGVLAGFLGSYYDEEIVQSLHFALLPGGTFQCAPTMFWLMTLIFAISFGRMGAESQSCANER
ncbi:hypothetical protein HHL21_19710 [Massilia sp. RP-1-19]|uniref:Uncharacterized protein n=1 Tax=Massilia polaris TaxID=2728846 RepID=A0A848HPM5_9BURK|nr:hypothetical protein [Massilia polaris]NML63272.1 hypothetical protein [Massilia polaris]